MSPNRRSQPPATPDPQQRPSVQRIGTLVSQLMSRRGYAQSLANEEMHQLLVAEVGDEMAADCIVGKLRAGVLQIHVSSSATLQELNFRKRGILRRLQKEMSAAKVTHLKFRIQA